MIPYFDIDIWDILVGFQSFFVVAAIFIAYKEGQKSERRGRDKRHIQYNPPSERDYNYPTHYIDGGFNSDRNIRRRTNARKRQRKSS